MLTAARSITKARNTAEPLPHIPELHDLYQLETELYRGQVVMVAGQSGSQKSGFALWLATKTSIPCLYFSADSDAATMSSRTAAIHTNINAATIRADMADPDRSAYYADALKDSQVIFTYDASPTVDEMQQTLEAWVELYDTWPELIVVDNLTDLFTDTENEFAGNKEMLKTFKLWARETNALVLVLHHMSESSSDAGKPAPRKSIMGKSSQTPALILSVALDGDQFMVSPVKSRHSRQYPAGDVYATLRADPGRNQFHKQGALASSFDAQAWMRENVT